MPSHDTDTAAGLPDGTYEIKGKGPRWWRIARRDSAGHHSAVAFVSATSDEWRHQAGWKGPSDQALPVAARRALCAVISELADRFPEYSTPHPTEQPAELAEAGQENGRPRYERRELLIGDLYQGGGRPDIGEAGIELHGTSGARARLAQLSAVFTGAYVTGWSMRVEAAHAAMVRSMVAHEIAADFGADRGRRVGGGHDYILTWEKPDATVTATVPPDYSLPAYPAPGSFIPGQPGYRVGQCGHRVAASEWRAGFRVCEHCPGADELCYQTMPDGDGWRPCGRERPCPAHEAAVLRAVETVEDAEGRVSA